MARIKAACTFSNTLIHTVPTLTSWQPQMEEEEGFVIEDGLLSTLQNTPTVLQGRGAGKREALEHAEVFKTAIGDLVWC